MLEFLIVETAGFRWSTSRAEAARVDLWCARPDQPGRFSSQNHNTTS